MLPNDGIRGRCSATMIALTGPSLESSDLLGAAGGCIFSISTHHEQDQDNVTLLVLRG